MKRKVFIAAMALTLATSMTFTSCIGSFGLSNKVLNWNRSIGDKFINEVVFLALWIVPVYEICALADVVVLNSIEFWSGNNPVASGETKQIQGENGEYTVESTENGYNIKNEAGQEMSLIFDEDTQTWSSVAGEKEVKLFTFEDEDNVTVYLPNGEEKQVELSDQGMTAFRETIQNAVSLATK